MSITAVAADPAPATTRTPRGYVPTLAFSSFGLFLALLGPTVGGLSVKVQGLVGLDDAPTQLGLLTGIGLAFSLFTQPIAGRLSDRSMSRFGRRRPFIIFGVLGLLVALFVCGIAPNIPVLIVGWCAAQFFGSIAQAAQNATVADQVPEPKRGGVSGILGAATPLGLLVGAVMLSAIPNEVLRFVVPGLISVVTAIDLRHRAERSRPHRGPDHLAEHPPAAAVVRLQPPQAPELRLGPAQPWAHPGRLRQRLDLPHPVPGHRVRHEHRPNSSPSTRSAQIVGVGTLVVFSVVGGFISDRVGRRKPFILGSGLMIALGVAGVADLPAVRSAGWAGRDPRSRKR